MAEMQNLKKQLALIDVGNINDPEENICYHTYMGNCKAQNFKLFQVSLYEDYFYYLLKGTEKYKMEVQDIFFLKGIESLPQTMTF